MASVNKCECAVGENLEISRGDLAESPRLDLSKIENLIVYDEHGREIRVGDIYKYQKTILVLVRVSHRHHHHVRLLEVVKRNQHRVVAQYNSLIVDCESKKLDTKLLPITSPNINRF